MCSTFFTWHSSVTVVRRCYQTRPCSPQVFFVVCRRGTPFDCLSRGTWAADAFLSSARFPCLAFGAVLATVIVHLAVRVCVCLCVCTCVHTPVFRIDAQRDLSGVCSSDMCVYVRACIRSAVRVVVSLCCPFV